MSQLSFLSEENCFHFLNLEKSDASLLVEDIYYITLNRGESRERDHLNTGDVLKRICPLHFDA
jgi:hypothetical protein